MNQFTIAEQTLANKLANVLLIAFDDCHVIKDVANRSAKVANSDLRGLEELDKLPIVHIANMLRHYVPQYAQPEDLPAAIKAVAGYAAEIACNKLERHDHT